ncbi:hypothetical protein EKO04_004983 [Ascochyta lentis]|uniref:DUF6604 domain-containing protein n=1 Tax=Ascochyta lentis TaxID=205686 RepID=A0A8H7J5L3_9PLEO|nr:hypothetical protein EKO04_004983 [Ascochyta lentis]
MHKSNKWRRRIIRLLDDLLLDLQSLPPTAAQAAVFEKPSTESDRADSMFEGVEGVETTESLYFTDPMKIPTTKDPVIYKLKPYDEDTAFAIYCLFQDATYLRLFSARAWREFRLGAIGIQTATFCTNVVCSSIEELSAVFLEEFGRFGATESSRVHTNIDSFFRQHCGTDAVLTDGVNPDCEDVSFARNAKRRLGFYINALSCSRITRLLFESFIARPGQYWGTTLDDMRLLKSLYQLRLLSTMSGPGPTVWKMDCIYPTSSSLVNGALDTDSAFAAQILWDIQQEVDPQTAGVEDILARVSQDMHSVYLNYDHEWYSEKVKGDHRTRDKRMEKQFTFISETITHISKFQIDMEWAEHLFGRQCSFPGFQLLSHVPLLVGQQVAQYRYECQESFTDITNGYGHVLTAMHLYNAAKESGSLGTVRWEDMEFVIHQQCYNRVFAGDPPADNSEYLSRFCFVYGLDQTKFKSDRKPVKMDRVKNDIHIKGSSPRRLECPSEYIREYSKLKKGATASYTTLGSIDRITAMEEYVNNQLDQCSFHGQPSTIGFLIAAKEAYENDEEALTFDIYDFHMRCCRLLRSIRDLCLREAPEDYPAVRFAGDDGLNTILAELLRDLSSVPRHHEPMWPKAVKLLWDLIEMEGSICVNAASVRVAMTTLEVTENDDKGSSDGSESETALETPLEHQSPSAETNERRPEEENRARSHHEAQSARSGSGSDVEDERKEPGASSFDDSPLTAGG